MMMTKIMDIDEALLAVGGMRPYQWLLFIILNIATMVPIAANAMFYVLIGWTTGHHCKPGPDSGTHSNSSFGYQFNASLPHCHMLADDNTTVPCQHGWLYDVDLEKENSIVTEWDLVCDDDYQSEMTELYSSAGAIVGLIFLAPLSDKYGRKPVFLLHLLLYLVTGTALAFAHSLLTYNIIRFFFSIATDVYTCAGLTWMMELYSTKHRSFAGVGLEFFWLFAYFYLALLMYYIRLWNILILVTVLPWAAFLGLYWLVPESAPWLLSMNEQKEAKNSLNFLAKRNCVKWDPHTELVQNNGENTAEKIPFLKQLLLLMKDPVLRKHTLISCLFWFTNYNIYMGVIVSMPSLAGNKYLSFTLGGVVEAPAYILCFFIVPYGRRIPAVVFHLIAGLSLFLAAAIISLDLGGEHQRTIMLVVSLIGKFGISASFTVMVIYCIELFPTSLRGAGGSYSRIFGRFGSVGSPFIAYWLRYNPWQPLIAMGLLAVITAIATLVLPETCEKDLPQTLEDVYDLYQKNCKVVSFKNDNKYDFDINL